MKAVLVTGRSLGHGLGLELGKFSDTYYRSATACEMNPEDMREIGAKTGGFLLISTSQGSVVVRAVEAHEDLPKGMVFIPYGPWINSIMDAETQGTGMPSFKGLVVDIRQAETHEVLRVEQVNRRVK